jgi:hypothetical protein
VLAALGVASTAGYLIWRAGWSLQGAPLWLSVPALVVEVLGFLGSVLLVWTLWARPPRVHLADAWIGSIDVVVRVDAQPLKDVRATLLAVRAMAGIGECAVVDLSARPEVVTLALEFRAGYRATDPDDHNGLRVAATVGIAPAFALIEAGDVPHPDMVTRLGPILADPRVGAVQGLTVSLADDTLEHGPNGVHDLVCERTALNPRLGSRGVSMITGSGSLIRRSPLLSLSIGQHPPAEQQAVLSAQLMAGGWQIVAVAGDPVVATAPVYASRTAAVERLQRSRAAYRLLGGRFGALRGRHLGLRERMALLTWSVRPMSGVRRAAFVALLVTALLAGRVPFNADLTVLVAVWLPGAVATSVGLSLLSGGTLRIGDRTRWSLQTMGAGLCTVFVASYRIRRSGSHSSALVAVVTVLSAAVGLRAMSNRWTDWLRPLPPGQLAALLAVSLWLLAMSLDTLRLLAGRAQLRRAHRVPALLNVSVSGRRGFIADLSAFGAGVVLDTELHRDDAVLIATELPSQDGRLAVVVPGVVRNVRRVGSGMWRTGMEFGAHSPAVANALAEYCTIAPALRGMTATVPAAAPEPALVALAAPLDDRASPRWWFAVRFTALLAMAAVISTAAPSIDPGGSRTAAEYLSALVALCATALGASTIVASFTASSRPMLLQMMRSR